TVDGHPRFGGEVPGDLVHHVPQPRRVRSEAWCGLVIVTRLWISLLRRHWPSCHDTRPTHDRTCEVAGTSRLRDPPGPRVPPELRCRRAGAAVAGQRVGDMLCGGESRLLLRHHRTAGEDVVD